MQVYKIIIISDNPFNNEEEKKEFLKYLPETFEIKEFKEKEIENSFYFMKRYKSLDTFIILSEGLKNNFLFEFKLNIKDFIIIPRIFTLPKTKQILFYTKNFIILGKEVYYN